MMAIEPAPDFSDFDRYCDEHGITDEETPIAFAAWMNERTGWDGPAERWADEVEAITDNDPEPTEG